MAKKNFNFAPAHAKKKSAKKSYNVLIVDDDQSVHIVTKLSLKDFIYEDANLEFTSAFSAKEAKKILKGDTEFAVILLDVVMESETSGLEVADYIRNKLNNHLIRITLRTGQPGQAPEQEVIVNYDIDNYRNKTELSTDKLFSVMYTSIRSYKKLKELELKNKILEEEKYKSEHYAKELAQSLEFKTQFFRNISHELKTPLNSIITLTEILTKTKKENITPSGQEKLNIILKSGKTLLKLIEDILTLTRIEANKHVINNEEFFTGSIAEATYELFYEVATKKNIELILKEDVSLTINNDKEKLIQVINNLVSNAIKFTHDGSVTIHFYEHNQQLVIEVTDTGIGIEKKSQQSVFEAFTQADATIKRKFEGSGVGLAICKEYVALMGGTITLKSNLGNGSTFSVFIPVDNTKKV